VSERFFVHPEQLLLSSEYSRLSRHEKYIDQSLTALFSQYYFCSEMLPNRNLPVYFSRFEVTVEFGKGRSLISTSRLLAGLHLQIYIWLDYNLILLPSLFFPLHAVHSVSESYFHSLFCTLNTHSFFLSCARLFKNMFWITYCELFLLCLVTEEHFIVKGSLLRATD